MSRSVSMRTLMKTATTSCSIGRLDPEIVDRVLDSLWKSDRIEGILTLGGRHSSLDDIRRVLPDRPRLWGEDGRHQAAP